MTYEHLLQSILYFAQKIEEAKPTDPDVLESLQHNLKEVDASMDYLAEIAEANTVEV